MRAQRDVKLFRQWLMGSEEVVCEQRKNKHFWFNMLLNLDVSFFFQITAQNTFFYFCVFHEFSQYKRKPTLHTARRSALMLMQEDRPVIPCIDLKHWLPQAKISCLRKESKAGYPISLKQSRKLILGVCVTYVRYINEVLELEIIFYFI